MPIIFCSTAIMATPPRAAIGRNGRRGCGSSWRVCSTHSDVVPAKAGTHNHRSLGRPARPQRRSTTGAGGYGSRVSLRSPGTTVECIEMTGELHPRHHHVFDLDIFFHAVM